MRHLLVGVRALSALMSVIDLALVRLWAVGDFSTAETLASHIALTAAVGSVVLALRWRDRVRTAISLLVCLVLGPIGGFVLLIGDLGRDGKTSPAARPAPLAVPPSRAELLHADILQNRRRRPSGQATQPFAWVLSSGTLARKQEVIAAISRNYRPEMLPALRLALASDAPALRVQAAAVYARLRGSFGDRAKAVSTAALSGRLSAELAAEAEVVAASGFVDEETAAELRASAVCVPAPPPPRRPLHSAPRPERVGVERPPRLKRHACGGVA